MSTSAQNKATFIASEADLLSLLDSITDLPINSPSLYLNLKGINLGRHGSISIIFLHIAPTQKTYRIDIHSLGRAAFSSTNKHGTTLKSILESPTIPKVAFDIRNASDALFHLFQISVDGIRDIQLMELACRNGSRQFVSSLAKCIENDSPDSAAAKTEWRLVKERRHERPLGPEIAECCKQEVAVLPGLYDVYDAKLRPPGQAYWRVRIRNTTRDRIKLSRSLDYDGTSTRNALGWDDEEIEEDREAWNDELLMEIRLGKYVLDENDEWVPAPDDDFEDFFNQEGDDEVCHEDDWGDDTARDCIGWEEDMVKNGEFFI